MILESILGGLTGLFGNVVTGFINYKTLKIKNEHEVAMLKAETEAMTKEAEMQIQVAKVKTEGEIELADTQAYIESQKAGREKHFSDRWIDKLLDIKGKWRIITFPAAVFIAFMFGLVDWLRGFMRPALTIYLTGMSTVITWMAWNILQEYGIEQISMQEAIGIYNQVVSIIIYLTVSCVTWWFGDRRLAKFLTQIHSEKQKNNDSINVGM